MRFFRPLLLLSVTAVLVTGILLAFFHHLGLFQVASIPVEVQGIDGAKPTSRGPAGLQKRLELSLKKFANRKIWEVDLKQMNASVAADEWVKDVLISRSFPNHVLVSVTPKTTALVYLASKGDLIPVTEDGAMLSALASDSLPDVPVLRGEILATDTAARKSAIQFAMHLPEDGALNRRNISEIAWDKTEGFTLTLIQPKVEVKLGLDGLSMKVLRVAQVLNYLNANQLKGRVIDASFSKKILVRLRKTP
jgi:cell division septal protein FtsQ